MYLGVVGHGDVAGQLGVQLVEQEQEGNPQLLHIDSAGLVDVALLMCACV